MFLFEIETTRRVVTNTRSKRRRVPTSQPIIISDNGVVSVFMTLYMFILMQMCYLKFFKRFLLFFHQFTIDYMVQVLLCQISSILSCLKSLEDLLYKIFWGLN